MEEIGVITAIERQQRNKSRVSVFVDGQYLGSVEDIVWARAGLKSGDALRAALWEDMQTRQEAQAALDRALKRLATRARGRTELEQYLAERGFSEGAVQAAISKLTGYGYINDAEFAAQFVRGKTGQRPTGRRALSGELKRLGIGEEDAAAAMQQYGDEDELQAALRQAEKDIKRTAGEQDMRKRRAKVYASLARRGFSTESINSALSRVFSSLSEE